MAIQIALLGNAKPQAERLSRLLAIPHDYVDPLAATGPVAVDVCVTIRFTGQDGERVKPRLLQVSGAGLDQINFDALPEDCIVCNAFEHEGPIAEYTMLAILDHAIRSEEMRKAFRHDAWAESFLKRPPHDEIAGKTVGLIGFGHIAKEIAVRAKAFGMHVVAMASAPRTDPLADRIGGPDSLKRLLAESDFVVLACPLNEATRGLIGEAELRLMKPTALLVNVARAEIVAEEPLYRALSSKTIAGAVLDTWYAYPTALDDKVEPAHFRFADLPNVRATAHSSAWTTSLFERRFAVIAENIRRFADGRPLLNIVRAPATT